MAFTYATTLAAVLAHAVAAGAALTVPITDVAIAHPLPKGRCIRIFYGGETDPEHMGAEGKRTLNSRLIAERIVIVAWFPVPDLGEEQTALVESEMYVLKHELRTRILGDSQLGGTTTDLDLSLFVPDMVVIGGVRYRSIETEVTTDFAEYAISP